MFILKGKVKILIRNRLTHEVEEEIYEQNTVTDWLYRAITTDGFYSAHRARSTNSLNRIWGQQRILLTDNSTPLQRGNLYYTANIPNPVAIGAYKSWSHNHDTADKYLELYNQITPPGAGNTRTFRTIALIEGNGWNGTQQQDMVLAALVLDSPATQTEFQYLDIFYQLFFSTVESSTAATEGIAETMWTNFFRYSGFSFNANWFKYSYLCPFPANPLYTNPALSGPGTTPGFIRSNFTYFCRQYNWNLPEGSYVGRTATSVMMGQFPISWENLQSQIFESGQGIFRHSSTSTMPFFNSQTAAVSSGDLIFGGTWTKQGKFPKQFRIEIMAGGAVGVSSYRLWTKRHLSFRGNTYEQESVIIPWLRKDKEPAPGFHGTGTRNLLALGTHTALVWDETGLTVVDIYDGAYTHFDSGNGLNVTNLTQVSCDRQCLGMNEYEQVEATTLWLACKATGLWTIDLATNTVTQLSSDPCYGVDWCGGTDAIAIFGGTTPRLALASNLTTPLDGGLGIDISTVRFLKCNPNSATYDSAIVHDNGGTLNQMLWWNTDSAIAGIAGRGDLLLVDTNRIDVTDVGSYWVGQHYQSNQSYFLSFGTTSATNLRTQMSGIDARGGVVLAGKYALFFRDYDSGYDMRYTYVYDLETGTYNTHYNGYPLPRYQYTVDEWTIGFHLGNVTIFGGSNQSYANNYFLLATGRNEPELYDQWGWDGVQWVKDNPNPKLTHTTDEPLFEGVTLAFSDGVSGVSFVQGDHFTRTYLSDGIQRDNGVSFAYPYEIFFRPHRFNETFDGSLGMTVPAASPHQLPLPKSPTGLSPDPDFFRCLNYHAKHFDFELDGVPVAVIHVDGTIPAAGEVAVDLNGILTFNSADAGKTITYGRYAYLLL